MRVDFTIKSGEEPKRITICPYPGSNIVVTGNSFLLETNNFVHNKNGSGTGWDD